jgi:hypothetical protein
MRIDCIYASFIQCPLVTLSSGKIQKQQKTHFFSLLLPSKPIHISSPEIGARIWAERNSNGSIQSLVQNKSIFLYVLAIANPKFDNSVFSIRSDHWNEEGTKRGDLSLETAP